MDYRKHTKRDLLPGRMTERTIAVVPVKGMTPTPATDRAAAIAAICDQSPFAVEFKRELGADRVDAIVWYTMFLEGPRTLTVTTQLPGGVK